MAKAVEVEFQTVRVDDDGNVRILYVNPEYKAGRLAGAYACVKCGNKHHTFDEARECAIADWKRELGE